MMRNRLYFDGRLAAGAELDLPKTAAHYLGRVLRLQPSDEFSLFNRDDGEWRAQILEMHKTSARVVLREQLPGLAESPLPIQLVQGISRGDRMDFVVQKATELGVQHITPVLTHHGVVRLDDKRAAKRQLHWQTIAVSACEQCGRTAPPLIDAPLGLNDWLGQNLAMQKTQLMLLPTATRRLTEVAQPDQGLCLLIGPEGGLSDKEVSDAEAIGFVPASLGPRVLRTETAALAALTLAQATWGDI